MQAKRPNSNLQADAQQWRLGGILVEGICISQTSSRFPCSFEPALGELCPVGQQRDLVLIDLEEPAMDQLL